MIQQTWETIAKTQHQAGAAVRNIESVRAYLRRSIKRLELAIESLPLNEQMLAEAYLIEGVTGPEIAEMFDMSEASVRYRLRRARSTLAELMRRWDINLGRSED